jgi:hypothetical protein
MFKNNSFNIHSLSWLSNNHLRDGSIIASRVMTGLFVEPDLTYPGKIITEDSDFQSHLGVCSKFLQSKVGELPFMPGCRVAGISS